MQNSLLDSLRIALYALLIGLGFILYEAWQVDHPAPQPQAPAAVAADAVPNQHFVPGTSEAPLSKVATNTASAALKLPSSETGKIVTVTTDVLSIKIDTKGGDIIGANLLKYPVALHSPIPFTLLNNDDKTRYIAESGLLSQQGPDTTQHQANYTVGQSTYAMAAGQNNLQVILTWKNAQGLQINKIFTFTRNSYEVKVDYEITNNSDQAWQGNLYTQLLRTNTPPPTHGGLMNLTTFFGGAISTPQKPFEKISFKQMLEHNYNQTVQGGWAAMIQHYFISAWVPTKDTVSTYYTRVTNGLYTLGMIGNSLHVAAGEKLTVGAKLYTGPAIADRLEQTASGLKLTIDYGWFWFISDIIFIMLQKIHSIIGNWGWSIVLVTIIIKLLFYKLSAKSYRSMSGLKKLQPKLEALKQRYGDDRQKLTQATLELYKQEKVNPMSGCLPILIQIPVFIALYWVLVESVQLRQAPFILWIHDLTLPDPYYVLPVMMGISMFLQQRLNPPPPDPMQAKVMMLMPVIFTVLFANFPAGLMLYWFVNNTLSFLQQWHIMRNLDKETGKRKRSKK